MYIAHDRDTDGYRVVWPAEKSREREFILVLMPCGPGDATNRRTTTAISGPHWRAGKPWTLSPRKLAPMGCSSGNLSTSRIRWATTAGSEIQTESCFSARGFFVHTPCGPRKSGMPDSVEIPAPVSITTLAARSTQLRTSSFSMSALYYMRKTDTELSVPHSMWDPCRVRRSAGQFQQTLTTLCRPDRRCCTITLFQHQQVPDEYPVPCKTRQYRNVK